MSNKDIHIRKIEIYEGVMTLSKEGKNLNNIKVSDIAKASNLGKGTIYDYFRSKDEIIAKSIIYNMNLKMDLAFKRVSEKETFEEKYYAALNVIEENMNDNISLFGILLSLEKSYELLVEFKDKNKIKNFDMIYENICKRGKKEELINPSYDTYYIYMAIGSGLLVFNSFLNHKSFFKTMDVKEAMDNSYNIVLNALK